MTYSYSIVEAAARIVQNRVHWINKEKIKVMKFTDKWVTGILSRGGLHCRKITREDKVLPSDSDISYVLRIGQELYIRKGHNSSSTFNFDETAFTWAIGPTHMFCPSNQQRATNFGISNTKLRITAIIVVNAEGIFTPLMIIIKHSVSSEKRPDQTKMTVICDLHKKHGFTVNDGWMLKVWSKELTVKGITALHKIIYIIHEDTGHVITSQFKAWNDSVRMCMWFEVVIKPVKDNIGKMLLWCDNCGSHKTTCVYETIEEIGVDIAFLPKNMTGELQVLDLVVNGPLKAHIWKNRSNALYKSFQEYKEKRAENNTLPLIQRKSLEFDPPKPTQIGGMLDIFLLFKEGFTEEKFKECIKRTFIKTGTLPINYDCGTAPPNFTIYKKEVQNGIMSVVPEGTLDLTQITEEIEGPAQNQMEEIDALE